MTLKAKNSFESEQDHIRNTLTDVVRIGGETKAELKAFRAETNQRFDRLENKLDAEVSEIKEHLARQDADNAEIKRMLSTLLANQSNPTK